MIIHPQENAEINVIIKDKKKKRVIFTIFPFNLPVWPMQKSAESWIMTADYHEFNQVVILVVDAVPDTVYLLEQFA